MWWYWSVYYQLESLITFMNYLSMFKELVNKSMVVPIKACIKNNGLFPIDVYSIQSNSFQSETKTKVK